MPRPVFDLEVIKYRISHLRRVGRGIAGRDARTRVNTAGGGYHNRDFAGNAVAGALLFDVRDAVRGLGKRVASVSDKYAFLVVGKAQIAVSVGKSKGDRYAVLPEFGLEHLAFRLVFKLDDRFVGIIRRLHAEGQDTEPGQTEEQYYQSRFLHSVVFCAQISGF